MDSIKILNANVLNGSLEEIIEMSDEVIQSRNQIFGTGINLNQLYKITRILRMLLIMLLYVLPMVHL